MGHQLRLYLTVQDEDDLIRSLKSEFAIVLLRAVFFKEDERTISSLAELGAYPTDGQIALSSSDLLAGLIFTAFPEGHTRLDLIKSEVIQFNRSQIVDHRARPGRLWYELDSSIGKKSDEFKKWSSAVFRFVKASLIRLDAPVEGYAGHELYQRLKTKALELTTW